MVPKTIYNSIIALDLEMKENEHCHYTESIIHSMEQTVTYFRIKGAQFFNELKIGVTIDQFVALDAIYCNDDICQRDLSKLILKDRSNTGRILNILEQNGFIKREIETKGKRLVKKIYITDKGKKIIEDNHAALHERFANVLEDVSEEEFATLRNILSKLTISLSKTTNIQI
jgi:DNA-binding MarR family transcriptional regulator